MDRPSSAVLTPLRVSPSRYIHHHEFHFYYAYGNTVSEDFLESVPTNEANPSVLVLGCGDVRSCLYTIWKSFDPVFEHSTRFESVQFHLNDCSPAVLARNVLFLYLIMKLPSDPLSMSKWISAIWSIWYCHELLPEHKKIYDEALNSLISFVGDEKSWKDFKNNPLADNVSFVTDATLLKVCHVWKMWLRFSKSVEWMNTRRRQMIIQNVGTAHAAVSVSVVAHFLGLHFFVPDGGKLTKRMSRECEDYFDKGSVYIEPIFSLPLVHTSRQRAVNSSLFEEESVYTLHYASIPFKCYHYLELSSSSLNKYSIPKGAIINNATSQPLLANCVQQFSIWLVSTAAVLKSNPHVTFSLECSDAINFSLKLQNDGKMFDAIFTSNLIDPLSPPAVVFSCVPLLKHGGLLFTTSLLSCFFSSSPEEFIETLFGIPVRYLPILFGIRCIGLDDADKIAPLPSVSSMKFLTKEGMSQGYAVQLIWERMSILLAHSVPTIDSANLLYKVVKTSVASFLESVNYSPGLISRTALCSQTAVEAMKFSASGMSSQSRDRCFIESTSTLLRKDHYMRPFLLQLQTQSLLNGMHVHLTVSDDDCPICNKRELSEFVCQLKLTVDTMSDGKNKSSPFFVLFLHKSGHDIHLPDFKTPISDGIHVIDSIICLPTDESNVDITFFLPLCMVNQSYKITVSKYAMKSFGPCSACLGVKLAQVEMAELVSCTPHYSTFICSTDFDGNGKETKCSLGCVVKSEMKDKSFFTVIAINEDILSSKQPFMTVQCSVYSFQVMSGDAALTLTYPMPISYMECKLKISRLNKQITAVVPLGQIHFYNDRPLVLRNPNNKLLFPTSAVNQHYMFWSSLKEGTPLAEVGATLSDIFLTVPNRHVHLQLDLPHGKVVMGLVIVHDRVYDVQSGLPALDTSFMFAKDSSGIPREILSLWMERLQMEKRRKGKMLSINLKDAEYPVLKKVFERFQKETLGQRVPLGIDKLTECFSRMLIFPLYTVHSVLMPKGLHEGNPRFPFPQSLPRACCSCCGKEGETRNCYCNKVRYCGKECLKQDWAEHQYQCICGHCMKSLSLKRCGRCLSISYCSQMCQKNDWTIHKHSCKKI